MQGNRRRLERVMDSMMRGEGRVRGTGWNYPDDRPPLPLHTGEPVKVVLLGGSLSLRGWNYPDDRPPPFPRIQGSLSRWSYWGAACLSGGGTTRMRALSGNCTSGSSSPSYLDAGVEDAGRRGGEGHEGGRKGGGDFAHDLSSHSYLDSGVGTVGGQGRGEGRGNFRRMASGGRPLVG